MSDNTKITAAEGISRRSVLHSAAGVAAVAASTISVAHAGGKGKGKGGQYWQ